MPCRPHSLHHLGGGSALLAQVRAVRVGQLLAVRTGARHRWASSLASPQGPTHGPTVSVLQERVQGTGSAGPGLQDAATGATPPCTPVGPATREG